MSKYWTDNPALWSLWPVPIKNSSREKLHYTNIELSDWLKGFWAANQSDQNERNLRGNAFSREHPLTS